MEREFKFRAWHNETEQMLFVGDSFGTKHPLDCVNYARQGQDVVLMQYVGLKDKNGKEIYEGDVVRTYMGNICEIAWDFVDERSAEHNYQYTGFCFRHIPSGENFHLDVTSSVEIIGNIYQHPELINKATS